MNRNHSKQAIALLERCRECGVFTHGGGDELLDANLVESGIIDSMSLAMIAAVVKKYYGVVVTTEQLVADLRSLNQIAAYIEEQSDGSAK